MAACGENVGKERKNMDSACRASREGRVPCPHKDCLGNGEFYVSGAGLDVHYRARHGSKPDGYTEKAAEKIVLCFAEMKEKLLEIEDFDGDMNRMAFEDTVDFVENPADGDTPSYVQQYLRSSTNQRVHLSLQLETAAVRKYAAKYVTESLSPHADS
uniref:Uncharacterized protein n=1 Tax=Branchiostoma floridae TaxID=7739 RepID=C3ZY51_BRAFL|eukprot:XP_002586522.1 hypothetical protein BRAFLDRAFT_106422 [Branchiostoma floridae]